MLNLWFDVDGVVCDSNEAWLRWVSKKAGREVTSSDLQTWTSMADNFGEEIMDWWKTPGSYKNETLPFEDTKEFLAECAWRFGKLNFITSSYPGMEDEKDEWLIKNFNGNNINRILHKWDKWNALDSSCVLIEDNKENAWKHVIKNRASAVQLNYEKRYPYANFDPEITSHARIHYATSYQRVLDILTDINGA